jgi:hypothetical protein
LGTARLGTQTARRLVSPPQILGLAPPTLGLAATPLGLAQALAAALLVLAH